MNKEILLSGFLGGIVIFAWMIISAGPLPLSGDRSQPIPNDKEIHTLLKERITAPGVYFLPDHPDPDQTDYPDYENEPLFSIIHTGRTPGSFLGQMIFELICIFGAPMVAAWMLSLTSEKILDRYSRRVLFITGLGLFLALFGNVLSEKPLSLLLLSSLNHLITWTLVGLVIAWRIRPETG